MIVPETLRIISGGPYEKPLPPFPVYFRPPEHPLAVELRERYHLLEVAGDGDDFTRARRLKIWVRRQWNHNYSSYTPQDGLEILALVERGEEFNCAYFAKLYTQCCLAIGLPARLMGIARQDTDFPDAILQNAGHAVTEVYCRELGKWVMLDADANAFYTIDDVPANSLEVHRAWHRGKADEVGQVLDEPYFVVPKHCPSVSDRYLRQIWEEFGRHRAIDYYYRLHVSTLQGFSEPPPDTRENTVRYVGVTPPMLASHYAGHLEGWTNVSDESHFNWPTNRTYLNASMMGDGPCNRIGLWLAHDMPFFSHFEVSDGEAPFTKIDSNHSVVEVPAGDTRLRARCVDTFGLPGHEAEIVVRMVPASPEVLARRKEEYWLK